MDELLAEVKVFNSCQNKKNQVWATNIAELKHLDEDGNIFYQYVVQLKDSVKLPQIIAMSNLFFNDRKERFIIQEASFENNETPTLEAEVSLGVLDSQLAGLTYKRREKIMRNVHGWANVMVQFKQDRVRITVVSKEYRVKYYNAGSEPIQETFKDFNANIANRPPFVKMQMGNDTWYASFINLNIMCFFKTIGSYVDYMNKEYPKVIKEKEKENKEKLKNEDW